MEHIKGINYDFIPRDDEENTTLRYQFTDGEYVLVSVK